jgi:multidrug efflux system membrane fusion protein
MSNDKPNRTTTQAKDQQQIQGINADMKSMSTLYLGGTTYTPKSLVALIQSRIDQANEVATAKAAWQSAGKAYTSLSATVNVVEHDLKQLVISTYGAQSPKLADFGYTPRKKVVRTTEDKTEAVAKAKATRVARGTVGPKKKLTIKGTVPAPAPATGATPQVETAPAVAPAPQAPAVTADVMPAPASPAVASPAPAPAGAAAQAQPVAAVSTAAQGAVPVKSSS